MPMMASLVGAIDFEVKVYAGMSFLKELYAAEPAIVDCGKTHLLDFAAYMILLQASLSPLRKLRTCRQHYHTS